MALGTPGGSTTPNSLERAGQEVADRSSRPHPRRVGDVSPRDLDRICSIIKTVGWPHRPTDVAPLVEAATARCIRTSGELVAAGCRWHFGATHARIGLVVVDLPHQGKGVGHILMNDLLVGAGSRNIHLIATNAGLPLYESLGFVAQSTVAQHQGYTETTPHLGQHIRPGTPADIDAIHRLDTAAFCEDRLPMLTTLLQDAFAVAVCDRGRGPDGYATLRRFGRGSVVGPVVASTASDAIALFDALARPGFLRVDAAHAGSTFANHVSDRGLPMVAESPAMVLGTTNRSSGSASMFALASHALG